MSLLRGVCLLILNWTTEPSCPATLRLMWSFSVLTPSCAHPRWGGHFVKFKILFSDQKKRYSKVIWHHHFNSSQPLRTVRKRQQMKKIPSNQIWSFYSNFHPFIIQKQDIISNWGYIKCLNIYCDSVFVHNICSVKEKRMGCYAAHRLALTDICPLILFLTNRPIMIGGWSITTTNVKFDQSLRKLIWDLS